MNNPPRIAIAPGGPAVRVITRSDDAQLRLTYLANLEGLDLRIFRRSPAETDQPEAYAPTSAGLVIPRGQIRDVAGALNEIAEELDR